MAVGRVRSDAAPESEGMSVLSGMRFLCAEDKALNAEIFETILKMYGAACTISPTARSSSRPSRWSSPSSTMPS